MSEENPQIPTPSGAILCLGEVIADLVCETEIDPGEKPLHFAAHPGGALANVAVAASRAGAEAAVAGGVGDDETGRWLLQGLRDEGVNVDWVAQVEGADTPVALVMFDNHREPRFQVYGEHIGPTMLAAAPRLSEAVSASAALVIGSNTMVGEAERAVTVEAVLIAQENGIPVLFDPNFRPNRWDEPELAAEYCRQLCAESAVLKCNRHEAELMTGINDPAEAAVRLSKMGPRLVVVTAGADRVVTAGAATAEFTPSAAEVISPLGAGDTFMGTFAAGLEKLDWDFSRAGEALPEAVAAATATCGRWSAQ